MSKQVVVQMAAVKPAAGKPGLEEEGGQIHRIRITLTSRNVKNLEKGTLLQCLQQSAPLHCWRVIVTHRDTGLFCKSNYVL